MVPGREDVSHSGLFLVVEGVDGAGKSTQISLLGEWLAESGVPHLQLREPGGTEAGERVRSILLDTDELGPRAELLLVLAARAALVEERIRPALAAGRVVLADRFDLSTLAYQGYGRQLPLADVQSLNDFATGGLRPDVTILLQVAPATGERRLREGGDAPDRIERAGADFRRRVAEGYRKLAKERPDIEAIPADGTIPEVQAEIRERLRVRFPETFRQSVG